MSKVYSHTTVRSFVLLSIIIFGIIEEAVLYFGFPEYYTKYTLFIPIYFLILGISLLLAISRIHSKQLHAGRALARLMLLNVAQLILSFGILYYYIRHIDEQRRTFLFIFGIFYILFLGLKMFVFYNIDSHHKKEKKIRSTKKNGEVQKK